jgi:anti-sigma B factor antagonist
MRVSLKPASAEIFVVESVLIAPEGELDIASLGEFRAALSEAASKAADRLVVDLSRLESIDSSGLGALVELDNRLRRENRRLAVVAPGGTAAALLMNLSGVQNRLVTYETEEAAIEGVS